MSVPALYSLYLSLTRCIVERARQSRIINYCDKVDQITAAAIPTPIAIFARVERLL
jgi:hypothetical protein